MFSFTYISGLVVVLVQVLSWLGIDVSVDALSTSLSTILTIIAGIVVAYRRFVQGDITPLGSKK